MHNSKQRYFPLVALLGIDAISPKFTCSFSTWTSTTTACFRETEEDEWLRLRRSCSLMAATCSLGPVSLLIC